MSDEPVADADSRQRNPGDGVVRHAFDARDSLEVEVTRLHPTSSRSVLSRGEASATDNTGRRGSGRRARNLLGGVLAVCVLAVCVLAGMLIALLVRVPLPAFPARAASAATPTPTESLALGADTITLGYAVPWGTLHVDGKPVSIPSDAPLTLTRGRHTLEYDAAPFAPVRCVLSVPAAPGSDTCPLVPVPNANPISQSRVVNIGDVPDNLPQAQLQALQRFAYATLVPPTSSITMLPGDHYADAAGTVQTTTTAFTAQQVLALTENNTGSVTSQPGQGVCIAICVVYTTATGTFEGTVPSATPASDAASGGWPLSVHFSVHWRYIATDGTVIADHIAPAPIGTPPLSFNIIFVVKWDDAQQTWQLADPRVPAYVPGISPSCTFSEPFLTHVFPGNITGGVASRNIIPSPQKFDEGCALAVHLLPGSANGPYQQGDALFLYRCGAFVAANPVAHQLLPQVPVASTHEADLATAWAQQADTAGGYSIPARD